MTQCRPSETHLPQLSNALGAPQSAPQSAYSVHQELIRRQGNKPEREYQELLPGMAVGTAQAKCQMGTCDYCKKADAPNSYWIVCTDGAGQPEVYRRTHTSLKIRSTPTECELKAQNEEWRSEIMNNQFHHTAVLNETRSPLVDNSAHRSSTGNPVMPPPLPNLPNISDFSQEREEDSQNVIPPCTSDVTLENTPGAPIAPVQ